MNDLTKKELVIEQYQTPANLEARIGLHQRFSTAVQPWHRWVFDQLDLAAEAHILELGCGPGRFWVENLDRQPANWSPVLVDLSLGMIAQARAILLPGHDRFMFAVADAGAISFMDRRFDAVIANHMLYHVRDLDQTLSEITHVLKPGGTLYAATNGDDHMRELNDITRGFLFNQPIGEVKLNFRLQNGADLLRPYFADIELRRFDDGLLVTEVEPLVNYALSRLPLIKDQAQTSDDQKLAFENQITTVMQEQDGTFPITKDTGLFIAHLPT